MIVAVWLSSRVLFSREVEDPYSQHFKSPLPIGSKLLQHQGSYAGFDASFIFLFQVPDDQLLNQLVRDWNLRPSVEDDHDTLSFVALQPPAWWLGQKELKSMPAQYEWIDYGKEHYRSVWVDREKGLLYAEYGGW